MTNAYSYNEAKLGDVYNAVDGRQQIAFRNLFQWHDECRRLIKLWHSWENRKRYSFHNNIDVPLPYKVVESTIPYLVGGTLEPGCVALRPEDKDKAWKLNQQLKCYLNTPAAKQAFAEATRFKCITGVGFIKDGWNLKQDRRRRWVEDDEELFRIASTTPNPVLRELTQSVVDDDPDYKAEIIEQIKAYLSTTDESGNPVCLTLAPSGNGFITYDVDQYDAPALMAVPTYDIAWLGTGQDIQQYEAIYHRYYVTKHQLRRILKQSKANESSGWVNLEYCLDHCSETNTTSEVIAQTWLKDAPDPNSIEFIEESRREENGEIVVTTICRGATCVVRRMRSPFFHNQFNFTRLVTYPSITDLRGTSVLRPIETLCMAVIKQMNSLLDNSDLIQNPAFVVSRGSQMTDRQLSLYAGKIITARPGDFTPITIPDVRGATQGIVNYLLSLIYSMSGCPEVLDAVIPFMGNGKGAPDLDALRFSTTARMRYQLNSDSIACAGLMERMCSNVMQFNREPRQIPFVLDGKVEYIDYEPSSDTGSFKFFTDASSMIAPDPAVLRAQLTGLLNMADGVTIAHKDEASGQYVQRLLANKKYLFRAWAETCNIGNPELFMVSPDSDDAIPSQQLPPMPQPAPKEEAPQGGGGQPDPNEIAMQLQQLSPEEAQQQLQQMEPGLAQTVMEILQQGPISPDQFDDSIPMDTGSSIEPEQAQAINSGDFSGAEEGGGFDTATGTNGMPVMLGGTQQMGSGRIIAPEQMAQGTNISDIRQSAENLQ